MLIFIWNGYDPWLSPDSGRLIIMDEIQRLPEIFAPLRGIIDKERRKGNKSGQFLFLGSASIDLIQQSGESLAGRIAYLELQPIDILEYAGGNQDEVNTLWLRGGFPESLLTSSEKDSFAWRTDFIKTYLERDIPRLGQPLLLKALMAVFSPLKYHGLNR